MTRATRTRTVTVRLSPDEVRASQLVASATCRTVSSLIQFALRDYITREHPAAWAADATVSISIIRSPDEPL